MHKEKKRKMVHFGSMLSTQQNDVVRVPKRRRKKNHSAKPLYLKIQSPKVNAREKLGPGFRF